MERERAVITGLVALLVVAWLGFTVHRSPQFPGSLVGTLLGIAAALLMVVPPLAYSGVKRWPGMRQRVASWLPLRRLLAWHLWAGILGALLALVHSAHRFESALGIALAGTMLLVIFSGYVGRHFLGRVSLELRDRQALLEKLMAAYNALAADVAARPQLAPEATARAADLTASIADLEYAIKADELMKKRFRIWLGVHIAASVVFYGLLALHVWSALYFGLRWLA